MGEVYRRCQISGGRPRKIRSRPTSGVGGRLFTDIEKRELRSIGEEYGLDGEDAAARDAFLTRLWEAYGSYCASENALAQQVGVADEVFDGETLLARARRVEALVQESTDLTDDQLCLKGASDFWESLRHFPNGIAVEIAATPDWRRFEQARRALERSILGVRRWALYRDELLGSLQFLIQVVECAPLPTSFTKRPRQARDMFARELRGIYLEILHPLRKDDWRETHRGAKNDPPPRPKTREFSKEVMDALGVSFEVKRVSG